MLTHDDILSGLQSGSRRSLAKAITLCESKLPGDRTKALKLLEHLRTRETKSLRIGISGSPGVGKSTFIESFGKYFLNQGHKLAVLTIDPTSPRSSGSILGDKTRMEELTQHPHCFIRPSPAGVSLGGVARRTREAILLCEASGFDTILIETVGVGQSEHIISTMVDIFMYLTLPHAGDQLQGIKRGILELSDVIVVTKADGDLKLAAEQAALDHKSALHYLRPDPERLEPQVFISSAYEKKGLDLIYNALQDMLTELLKSGKFETRRSAQNQKWFESEVYEQILEHISHSEIIQTLMTETKAKLLNKEIPPPVAAAKILAAYFEKNTL